MTCPAMESRFRSTGRDSLLFRLGYHALGHRRERRFASSLPTLTDPASAGSPDIVAAAGAQPDGNAERLWRFLLRYGACARWTGRRDRSKFEGGRGRGRNGPYAFPQCSQRPARLDLEAEPPRSRLAQFLSRGYPDRVWRVPRLLSGRSGLG